jgi:hypothetical protein
MAPQTLLLMRHAEKPSDDSDPDLSTQGLERANNLPARVNAILGGTVQYIFAATDSTHSNRPVETVTPLSLAIGVDINSDFADGGYATLAGQILTQDRYRDKRIAVCWHHDNLPNFAAALGAVPGSYPNPWPSRIFDLILVFEWDGGTLAVTESRDKP